MTSRTLALAPPGHPVLPLLLRAAVLTSKGSNTAAIIRRGSDSSSGYCYVSFYLGLGILPPSDVWKKLRRFDVKTSVSDLQVILEYIYYIFYILSMVV